MSRRQRALNDMQALAKRASNEGFENFDGNYEVAAFENFLTTQRGMTPSAAKDMARQAVLKPAIGNEIRKGIMIAQGSNADGAGIRGGIGPVVAPTPGNPISAAKLTLLVTRPTANIPAPLPFALLGACDCEDGYRRIIGTLGFGPTVPPGTVLTSVRFGENAGFPNSLVFTYTAPGPLVDTVVVSCPTTPYPVLLKNFLSALIEVNKIRMKISNSALLAQFDELFTDIQHSPFGPIVTNPVTPSDFQSPEQFQQGIVDIDLMFAKDLEGSWGGSIIATAAFQVSFGLFISKFYRQSAKGWA